MRGTIKRWYPVRGFGFIKTDEGPDIFAHASDIIEGRKELCPGDVVEFEPDFEGERGPRAYKVKLVEEED